MYERPLMPVNQINISDHLWYGVTVKVLVVFCIGLALVTTLFGALTNMVSENRKRVIEVTVRLVEKLERGKKLDLKARSLTHQPIQ